jgi:hypothetical protein
MSANEPASHKTPMSSESSKKAGGSRSVGGLKTAGHAAALQDSGYALNRQVEGRGVSKTPNVRQDHDAELYLRQQKHVSAAIADFAAVIELCVFRPNGTIG